MHYPPDRITHTTAFVTPVVEHWLEREIAQWVHPMKDRSDDPPHHERTLLPRSYISLHMQMTAFVEDIIECITRKEIFYLVTHSTHFIYGYMASSHVLQLIKDHSQIGILFYR